MRTQDPIISRMERCGVYAAATGQGGANKKYCRTTHKFGIEVPKTLDNALGINCKMGTDFWEKDMREEINNFRFAF